jgi:ATP synthase protein I
VGFATIAYVDCNQVSPLEGCKVEVSVLEDAQEAEFKPLTREQAQALRLQQPQMSPWRVIAVQALVGFVLALLAAAVTAKASVGWSAGYGALAVIIPGAVFARGLTSKLSSVNAGAAMLGFFFWEAVKLALAIAMLFAAPKVVTDLSWPALLLGLVVTMKAIWVMLLSRKSEGAQK